MRAISEWCIWESSKHKFNRIRFGINIKRLQNVLIHIICIEIEVLEEMGSFFLQSRFLSFLSIYILFSFMGFSLVINHGAITICDN